VVAKTHDFTGTEVKAGFMVLGAVAAGLLMALAALNRPDLLQSVWSIFFGSVETHHYVVKFEEASGLNRNADVRYGGAKAGKVVDVSLDADARRIVAHLQVNADVPVNAGSRASISQATLTSEPHVEISVGTPEAALLMANGRPTSEATLYRGVVLIETEPGGLFGAMSQLASDLRGLVGVDAARSEGRPFTTVTDVMDGVLVTLQDSQSLVQETTRMIDEDLAAILGNTREMTASGRELAARLDGWMAENDPHLSATIQSAHTIANDLAALTSELEQYRVNLAAILNHGEGITDEGRALLERNAPVIEDMLGDLREAMRFFVSFAEVLAESPQALLRGKQEGGRQADDSGTLGREPDRR
jgi:ABC-type transporter Mla subunit MlaD